MMAQTQGPAPSYELQGLLRGEDDNEVTLKTEASRRYFSHVLAGGKLSSKGKMPSETDTGYLKPSLENWLLAVSMTRSFTAWREQILVDFLQSSSPFTETLSCPLSGRT